MMNYRMMIIHPLRGDMHGFRFLSQLVPEYHRFASGSSELHVARINPGWQNPNGRFMDLGMCHRRNFFHRYSTVHNRVIIYDP